MQILNHFQHINLTQDQAEAVEAIDAFLKGNQSIFMLKGYAGTGKTTLIKGLVSFLNKQDRAFEVMAPTGRAAKILREKTGYGNTIHSSIYELDDVHFSTTEIKGGEKDENYKLIFPLRKIESRNSVIIIDESSMISSKENKHPVLQFGSDILLRDLLTYAQPHNMFTKIIFVGDPAQLPPVGDNKSWAFEPKLFRKKGLLVNEIELKEVKRQTDNLILENAFEFRNKINEENPTELLLKYDLDSFIQKDIVDFTQQYVNEISQPELKSGVIIAHSNTQCYHYNNSIRDKFFPGQKSICVGDVIQITNNNYRTYPVPVYNGDFAKVLEVDNRVETLSAPVWTEVNGKKVKKIIQLSFRKIRILLDDFQNEFECMILDSLLNSPDRDLSLDEMKALYINFIMRFDEEQNRRRQRGEVVYKRKSKEYKDLLLSDPYLNALKCKYGYAITCHKAQGGEWDKVFVDFSGRVSLKKDPLRWCYTAVTRAVDKCYVVNPPHFTKFSKFKIRSISQIGKISKEAFVFDNVECSPFHQENQHRCKSKKYWEIVERLEGTAFKIEHISSKDFQEKYTISYGDDLIILEGYHKGSGVFEKGFSITSSGASEEVKNEIEEYFNKPMDFNYGLAYLPSMPILIKLYSVMQEFCKELEIPITNVVESLPNSFVRYYLQTDSVSSNIQFYVNKDGLLTSALPSTYKCQEDAKLQLLIDKLNSYVV